MSDTVVENGTEVTAETFRNAARTYVKHKRVIDAIATGIAKSNGGYGSIDDALAQIVEAWGVLRSLVENGGGYTPPVEMGFGSNNAAQIASAITGDNTSVTETRKAFSKLGK